MSIWYQQPDRFSTEPSATRRWGFSAIPNITRSPFTSSDDPTVARSANAMYGLMPDYTRAANVQDGGDNQTRTNVNINNPGAVGGNPFAGMEFTDCT